MGVYSLLPRIDVTVPGEGVMRAEDLDTGFLLKNIRWNAGVCGG